MKVRQPIGVHVTFGLGLAVAISACGANPEWGDGAGAAGEGSPGNIGQVQLAFTNTNWDTDGTPLNGSAGTAKLGPTNSTAGDGPFPLELWVKPSGVAATRALLIDTAYPPNLVGGSSGNSVTAGVTAAVISGGGETNCGYNTITDTGGVIAGGCDNQAGDAAGTIGNAWFAVVGGGVTNQATAAFATVGGGAGNLASGFASTIAGGYTNTASGDYASVVGGLSNTASGDHATVAGDSNVASGLTSVIGGGDLNEASAAVATIGGGSGNLASADAAVVSGGESNTASGAGSVVPGGVSNTASGDFTFAGGQNAHANFGGCFVWADNSTSTTLQCGAVNKFVARAAGGVVFYSNSAATLGAQLLPNQTSFAPLSDRNAKTSIVPVNAQDVLKRFAAMPVYNWVYKADDTRQRHMGPMAQDFHATFGLGGDDDKHIATLDADGVMFAAIHGLHEKVSQLESDNRELKKRLDLLERPGRVALGSSLLGSSLGSIVVGIGLAGAFVLSRRRRTDGAGSAS